MKLSTEQLNSFKEIYKADCGIELSDAEANEQAMDLLRVMYLIYQPWFFTEMAKPDALHDAID